LQDAKGEETVGDDELQEPLQELALFWKKPPGRGSRNLKLNDTTSGPDIEKELSILESMPQVKAMGHDLLTFRKLLSEEKYSHRDPEGKFAGRFCYGRP